MNNNTFNITRVVAHYIKVSQNFKEGNITVEQLQSQMQRDVQAYLSMYNKGLLNDQEYSSILEILHEFEETFNELIKIKENINKNSNGKA